MNTNTISQALTLDQVIQRGGGVPKEARLIDFSGGRFNVPVEFASDPVAGGRRLMQLLEAMQEYVEQSYELDYPIRDCQVALARVLRAIGVAHSAANSPFQMPAEITVDTGFDDNGQMTRTTVPGDWMTVPNAKSAMARIAPYRSKNGMRGKIEFQFRRFDQALVNGLLALVRDQLEQNSIYRGHVLNGDLEYIDVSQVQPNRVVYTERTGALLNTWALSTITNADVLRQSGMKTKVSIMLAGTYGTGKTEFLLLISHVAWLHGWTVLFCRPGVDDFGHVLDVARTYMKHGKGVVVIAEDVESWSFNRERMLDMWDGFGSKQDNALFVVTSNFPDKLDPAMLRPGRLDTVIEIGHFDTPTFAKLCHNKLGDLLAPDIDWERAFAANEGYTPAFMVGALESVVRSTIARTGAPGSVTTDDLVIAAEGFRAQHDLQLAAANRKDPLPTMDLVFREAMGSSIEQTGVNVNVDYDAISHSVDQVVESRIDRASISLTDEEGNEFSGSFYTR